MPAVGLKPLQLCARLVLAGVLAYAGLAKLGDLSGVAASIANYRILEDAVVPFVAALLPAAEIAVAVALVGGPCVQGGALLSAIMLVTFAAGMAQARLRGIDVECGCFGPGIESKVSWTKVALNLALASVAGVLTWARPVTWRELLPPREPEGREEVAR